MAQYDITGVNYVSSGSRRGLLDLTIKLNCKLQKTLNLLKTSEKDKNDEKGIVTESGKYDHRKTDYIVSISGDSSKPIAFPEDPSKLILDENQHVIELSSLSGSYNYNGNDDDDNQKVKNNPPFAIELTTKEQLDEQFSMQDIIDFNTRNDHKRCIFEFEKMTDDNCKSAFREISGNCTVNPMNDLMDVMMKSMYKKGVNSNSIPSNPNVPKNIGQSQNEQSMNKNIDIYMDFKDYPIQFCQYKNYSWVVTDRTTKKPYILSTDIVKLLESPEIKYNYQYQLVNGEMTTNLYKSHDSYGVSCYGDYFLSDEERMDDIELIKFFTPERTINGIKYNYIMNIDQTGEQYLDNPTIYDDGNIPGSIYTGKNMYNSLYSVDMIISGRINNCRKYSGIQETNRGLMLKFFDNVDYDVQNDKSTERVSSKYPYQKVEIMNPIKSKTDIRHKSNLFSIKIKNSGLEQERNETYNDLAEKMRKDITNNIFKFTSNICPANTQLFDVYYTE